MISRKSQEAALAKLGYTPEQIKTYLDDKKEVDIELPDVHVYTPDQITELETNTRKGYIKEDAASEIWCRQMVKQHELGLTGADAKDVAKVEAALKAKWATVQDETETAKRLKELQDDFGKKDGEIKTWEQKYNALESEKLYRKMFFTGMSNALDDEEWITRLRNNFEIKKDGEVLGLFDKVIGKFFMSPTKTTLPFQQAWEQLRAAEPERFKSWVKAEPVVQPDPKKTHDPQRRNPANAKVPKYKNMAEIMEEVDKQYPPDKKGTKGWAQNRQRLTNELRAMSA